MKLAPNLREELIYEAHVSLFDSIPWMKYFSAEFIKSLAFFIEEYNYSEKEIIYQVEDNILIVVSLYLNFSFC